MSSTNELKVVLLGSESVGKSSIASSIFERDFNNEYIATIGACFLAKTIQVLDKTIKLQVWDIVRIK